MKVTLISNEKGLFLINTPETQMEKEFLNELEKQGSEIHLLPRATSVLGKDTTGLMICKLSGNAELFNIETNGSKNS